MIEAEAEVVSVNEGRAHVRVLDRQDGCGRCDEPGGCRSVRVAYAIRPPRSEFSLPDSLGVAPGERVTLRMQDGAALGGALASYGLGAILLIAGAAAAFLLVPGAGDMHALVGALAGLVLAVAANRLLHRSRRWRGALRIEMVRTSGRACVHDLSGAP